MKIIIISGICFWVGNIVWIYLDEEKVFFVPLAIFMSAIIYKVKHLVKPKSYQFCFIEFLLLLSYGNIIKQLFYTENIGLINDYVYGGFLFIRLIVKLWQTRSMAFGTK